MTNAAANNAPTEDLSVPAGRALNRARLFDSATNILALSDLFDPNDCEAVARRLEAEASSLVDPALQVASAMLAQAIRVAARIVAVPGDGPRSCAICDDLDSEHPANGHAICTQDSLAKALAGPAKDAPKAKQPKPKKPRGR